MNGRGDLQIIKQGLQDRAQEVCEKLLPDGRREGQNYVSHDPVQGDYDRKPTLKVRLRGNIGGWEQFRGGAEHARKDILGLVEYVLRTDTKGALAWARDFLGMKAMSRAERLAIQQAAQAKAKQRQLADEKNRRDRMMRADKLFQAGGAVDPAAIAARRPDLLHLLDYFAGREIPLEEVPNLSPKTFRFAAQTEWWKGAKYRTEGDGRRVKTDRGPLFPALHSAMRSQHGIVTACHCTFLDPIMPVKAPVDPAKLVFGVAEGAVIELALGPSNKPFWWTEEPHPLILGEGIETGLSLAIAAPEARVWAGGSITNMGNAPVHLDCVSQIILARDNNHNNPQAQRQLEQTIEKLARSGKPLEVINSHLGDDFNDLMQGESP
ncbi:toprim domain-containing protein [Phyllobacteriaceae bacterium JZ32]